MNIDLTNEVERVYGNILAWIPNILGALLILLVGYFVALGIKSLVAAGLRKVRLNERIEKMQGSEYVRKISANMTETIGTIVYWLVWILVISIAVPILNVPVLNQLLYAFYAYIPNIIASILILTVATLVSGGVVALVARLLGDRPTGKIVSTVTPTLIMTIAVFMILVQLKIAPAIVIITYAAIIGSLALGFALAFGLGGREIAAKMLDEAYRKGQAGLQQTKDDVRIAKERGQREAEEIKESLKDNS